MANMKYYIQQSWTGGIAEGSKVGYDNSYQDGFGIDFRSDPDILQVLPKLTKNSGSTVTDLVKWMSEYATDTWHYGDTGKIYKRTSAGTWSNPKTVSSSTGQGMGIFNDSLWYVDSDGIGKATVLTGSTVFTDDYFKSYTDDEEDYQAGSGGSYTPPTSISEAVTDRYTWTAINELSTGVLLYLGTKGTGNVSIVLHDSSNVEIARKQITTANLTSGRYTTWIWDSPARLTVGQNYHFHIISTVADSSIQTTVNNDLETAFTEIYKYYNDLDIVTEANYTSVSHQSIALTTALSEISTNRISFIPTTSSLAAVSLRFEFLSGTVTIVIHDEDNKLIGSVSSSTANSNVGFNRYDFTTPLDLIVGASYHIHIYMSSGTGSLLSSSSTLSTAFYKTHFSVLNADSKYHMMKEFTNLLCIGNRNFLATLDDSEVYEPERLQFLKGDNVRCLEVVGDYLAIACWRADDLSAYGRSRIYFWDGVSDTFLSFVEIDGQVNAMKADSNILKILHGTQGLISYYTGAITLKRQLKNTGNTISMEVLPGAVTVYEGIFYFGVSNTSSTTIDAAVYSYAKKDNDYPTSLTKDFKISTGVSNTGVTIGHLLGIGVGKFFVSWKDGSSYGVDLIDTANPQASVFYQSMRFDAEIPNLKKHSTAVSLRYKPLTADQTITVEYRLNNTGSFTNLGTIDGATAANVSTIYTSFPFDFNWFEVEFKTTLATSSAVAPMVDSIQMEYNIEGEFQMDRE